MCYAKPIEGIEGNYSTHIGKCYEIAGCELRKNTKLIEEIATELGEKSDRFVRFLKTAVLVHDTGKLNPLFQKNMADILNGVPVDRKKLFRHEVLSCLFLVAAECITPEVDYVPYHLYAVFSHHKPFTHDLRHFAREIGKEDWPELNHDDICYAVKVIKNLSQGEFDYKVFNWPSKSLVKRLFCNIMNSFSSKLYFDKYGIRKVRTLYGVIKGFLHFCDWVASSKLKYEDVCNIEHINKETIINSLKRKVENEGRHYSPRPFHSKCADTSGDLVAIAPTGSGKTEAALLWAINSERKKIIFLMPTRITSNSLYERMHSHYFSKDACGLTHSGAETYFDIKSQNSQNEDVQNIEYIHHKAFIPAVMVSTVDQILTCGFNVGLWSQKEYALMGSSVIFDEIQAYDTYTLALITETIKKIKRLKGRVMIMSATLPGFLRKHFLNILQIEEPVYAKDLMDRVRNEWRYCETDVEGIRPLILETIEKGKKTALVVNDVETAKNEYMFYKNKNIRALCIHSEFTMMDRQQKEKELTDGDIEYQLVIATQVIEVSLDISFDMMFSECAPFECLVQRAGRCNRYGTSPESAFIVFDASKVSLDYVYKESSNIIERTKNVILSRQGRLSESEIADMLEQVYENFTLYDENYRQGEKTYTEIENKYMIFDAEIHEELFTRMSTSVHVPIIPVEFQDEVIRLIKEGKHNLISLYEVPVTIGKFKKYFINRKVENHYELPIYLIDYSKETGIVYEKSSFYEY